MPQIFMIFFALVLLLVFPQLSYAMIELMPAFFAVAIGGILIIGVFIASVLKSVIIRLMAPRENLPSFKRIAAVAFADIIIMSLASTVAFVMVQGSFVPANPHKALALVIFFLFATVIHVVIAIWPNSFLIESRAEVSSKDDMVMSGLGMAAILALLTPLVVFLLCLIVGYSIGR